MNLSDLGLRETILFTATTMFIENGYHGLAMRQISDALGVSKAALYYYFKDKEELFLAIIQQNLDELESAIEHIQAGAGTNIEKITAFVEYLFNQPVEQRNILRVGSQEMGHMSETARQNFSENYQRQFLGKLQALYEAGATSGEFRPIDSRVAVWALLGLLYPYFYPSQTGVSQIDAQIIHLIIQLFLKGVALPE